MTEDEARKKYYDELGKLLNKFCPITMGSCRIECVLFEGGYYKYRTRDDWDITWPKCMLSAFLEKGLRDD